MNVPGKALPTPKTSLGEFLNQKSVQEFRLSKGKEVDAERSEAMRLFTVRFLKETRPFWTSRKATISPKTFMNMAADTESSNPRPPPPNIYLFQADGIELPHLHNNPSPVSQSQKFSRISWLLHVSKGRLSIFTATTNRLSLICTGCPA